jgi:hypothetical protein
MQPSLLEVLVIVAGVFLRRAGIPAAVVFLPLDTGLVQVLVIQAAIASAVSSTSLTRLYHGETPTALRVVVATQLNKSVRPPFRSGFPSGSPGSRRYRHWPVVDLLSSIKLCA